MSHFDETKEDLVQDIIDSCQAILDTSPGDLGNLTRLTKRELSTLSDALDSGYNAIRELRNIRTGGAGSQ